MQNLDIYQKQAVVSNSDKTLIVAPPGSGKTTVIINRINYLIEKNINDRNIIVLTFTKSAAENMKNRYMNIFNKKTSPFFGTFHGLFYKILLRYYGKLEIINTFEAFGVIKKQLMKASEEISDEKVKEILNNISLKKSSYNIDDFKPTIAKDIFEECYKAYEEYKEYKNLLDFDDLQKKAIDLLQTNNNVLNGYKNLFKYILVDEFQDCDNLQIEFLKLISTNIFCVGDEDQCIYSFRGSNPEVMVNFDDVFTKSQKIYLKYNYRSRSNIVDLSKKIIDENKFRHQKEIIANSKQVGNIQFVVPYDESEQSKFVAEKIKERILTGEIKYEDNAILYRTNVESRSIIDRLIKEKIPFKLLDKEFNFFKHFVCQDLIAYLKLAIDPTDKESFAKVINKPYRYVSKGALLKIKKNIEEINCITQLLSSGEIHPFQVRKLEELRDDIANLNKLTLRTAIDFILSDLDYLDYLKDYANKYNQNVDDLYDIVDEFKESAKEFKKILPFFEHIKNIEDNLVEAKSINQDAVILSTIHGVKGMEFKNVYLIDCVDEMLPHKNAKDHEEERRIFYVGLTRAIDNVSVYIPKNVKGHFTQKTPFVPDSIIKSDKLEYTGGFKVGQKVKSKVNGIGEVEQVKDGVVTIVFGNRMKRYDIKTVVEAKLIEIIEN
ncbi:MAG: ATP-dependent helicase [Sarcina sp.]